MSNVIRFLTTKTRAIVIENSMFDYVDKTDLSLEFGKSYALVGDFGTGGYGISLMLSGNDTSSQRIRKYRYISLSDLVASRMLKKSIKTDYTVYIDGKESNDYIKNYGWFVGQSLKSAITGREIKISSILNSVQSTPCYSELVDYFEINKGMGPYVSDLVHEKWRVSVAIGLLLEKRIFCYPYMNSRLLFDVFYSSGNALSLKKVTEMGGIVIIPTNDLEMIEPIVDEVIVLRNTKFDNLDQYVIQQKERLGI